MHPIAQLINGRDMASDKDHHTLGAEVLLIPQALLLIGQKQTHQVRTGFAAAEGHEAQKIAFEVDGPVVGPACVLRDIAKGASEKPDGIIGPSLELLAIIGGDAEHLGDGDGGQGLGEISDKIHHPTEAEVAKFYAENKANITGDLDSVRNGLVNYLQNQDQQRLEKDLSTRLRKSADIKWLITEPPQPVQNISVDDDPARGDANAPVTIVEFTDFQCPACGAMHPVLEEVLKSYGNKVRFVVRDFPLVQHENAAKAAEAADAANAQGKFFEYTDILFNNQKALDVASLKKYASQIGLNRARFDAELDKGIYAAEIKHDIEDGEIYGVGSTPTIFINGVKLKTLSADDLRAAIDKAAAHSKISAPPQ